MTTTTFLPDVKTIERNWLLIDAKDQILGRLASRIALILRGKHKVIYTPFLDTGDFVVVINAEKIAVTGKKRAQKTYKRYSGYPGGQRTRTLEVMLKRYPDRVLRHAVKGMIPEGPLGRQQLGKLKIYVGADHPHKAQQPKPVDKTFMGTRAVHG